MSYGPAYMYHSQNNSVTYNINNELNKQLKLTQDISQNNSEQNTPGSVADPDPNYFPRSGSDHWFKQKIVSKKSEKVTHICA